MTKTIAPIKRRKRSSAGRRIPGTISAMAEFIGFTDKDASAIHESGLVVRNTFRRLWVSFIHTFELPPTRTHFLKADGTVDRDICDCAYHLTNFWRRTASGKYDDDYAFTWTMWVIHIHIVLIPTFTSLKGMSSDRSDSCSMASARL
jgi:hypothetical protein